MRRGRINIKFQSPQDLILIDADILLQFLHFILVEGLHPICAVIHDVVETITEGFDAAIYAF